MIDTDNMTLEEMDIIIKDLRTIRARKVKAVELKNRMFDLLTDAKENGFIFVDDTEHVWSGMNVEIYDQK